MPSQIDLGIIILYTENQFFIESITPNSSAAEANPKIEDFDIITHIDDEPLTDNDTYESVIAKLHSGDEGSTVKLTLFRAESPIFDVILKRKLVESNSEEELHVLKDAMKTMKMDEFIPSIVTSEITPKELNEYGVFKKYLNEKGLNDGQQTILRSLYATFANDEDCIKYKKNAAAAPPQDKYILKALKTGTARNNVNYFVEIMLKFNEFEIPILLRYAQKFGDGGDLSLSGIYFMGTDTDIKECKIKKCNIIHDLYELTHNGSKLNKTDLEISAYHKDDTYDTKLRNLKEYIDTSGTNIFSILILSKLPTDHNTFKIISKEMLLTLSDIPLAVAKAPFKIAKGVVWAPVKIVQSVFNGKALEAAATILKAIGAVLKGGNIKKTRKNRKYKRNVSRRYIRNGINNNICK